MAIELEAIDEQRFFQLVGHAQLVAAVTRFQLIAANPHVFHRIGHAAHAGLVQIAHLAAAHEIGDELELLAVPGVEIRAG